VERFVPSFFVLRHVYITQNDKASTGTCTHYRASNVHYSATDPSIRVEGAIRCGLDSPVEESEEENEAAPDGYEATLSSESGWIDAECIDLPPLTLKHIHQYFITGRLHKERVTASKPFERGYRLFSSRKVQCLSIHDVTSNSVYCIIRATVLPSQKSGAYKTAIALNKTNGHVIYGRCTCVAGNSACNHTAALMFAIDDMNRERASCGAGSSGAPSSTSLPRKWGVPAKSKKDPTPVNMLEVVKPKYGKLPQHTPTDVQPIDPSIGLVHMARIMSLREDLEKNCKDQILFSQVWPSQPDAKQADRLMKMQARPKT